MKTIISLLVGLLLLTSLVFPQIRTEELKIEARQLMSMGRYGEAIDVLNRFIAQNPQNVDGFLLRGTCYEKRGELEFAVYDYRTAIKISPTNREAKSKLKSATESWHIILYNKIEGHQREIAIHPDYALNYLEIGKSYKNLGEWKEAEIWYDEYLKREEPSADEVLRYAEILAKNNQLKKGEEILKKYSVRNSDDHRIWSRYGYFLYWLGKFQSAVNAFERSLEIRPFFKEALDGLDLARGRGYVYTINDTTKRFSYGLPPGAPEYKIDRLYRKIKNNPKDYDTRFELVDELVKAQRFEEAVDQLKFLSSKYSDSEDFKALYSKVLEYRNAHYKYKIDEYRNKLLLSPNDTEALLLLARYYSYQNEFENSSIMYVRYLKLKPDDLDARFSYAQLLSWNNELLLSKDEADYLLSKNPDKLEFKLLRANIGLWLEEDLEESRMLYDEIIRKQPDNKDALFGLAYLNLRLNNIEGAEKYYDLLKKDGSIPQKELDELLSDIEINKQRIKDEELYSYLENARKFAFQGECEESIREFEKYFDKGGTNKQIYFELANSYQCVGNFSKAINIYDDLITSGYDDYETLKKRAKIVFWSGDSLNALRDFKKLVALNPQDAESKLFLADSYLQLKQYQSAREIYQELLNESPESHILKTRMKWLGSEGITAFSFDTFPTYLLVSPQGNYFTDNTKFKYNLYGVGLEAGVTNFLSFGISGYRGAISSEFSKLNFNNLKGSLHLKINETTRASGSFGQTYFTNNLSENIIEASLNFRDEEIYQASFFYNNLDAAFILYSPFLVANRLTAEHIGFAGYYYFKSGLIISGKYAFINVSDGNEGNQLEFRLGKKFQQDIKAGYEYYYYTFSDLSLLYWSPENFESHSLWADFNLISDEETALTIGGKLGLIPQNDYLLREFFAELKYRLTQTLNVNAKIVSGSSSRSGVGYNSTSFQLSAFWIL